MHLFSKLTLGDSSDLLVKFQIFKFLKNEMPTKEIFFFVSLFCFWFFFIVLIPNFFYFLLFQREHMHYLFLTLLTP